MCHIVGHSPRAEFTGSATAGRCGRLSRFGHFFRMSSFLVHIAADLGQKAQRAVRTSFWPVHGGVLFNGVFLKQLRLSELHFTQGALKSWVLVLSLLAVVLVHVSLQHEKFLAARDRTLHTLENRWVQGVLHNDPRIIVGNLIIVQIWSLK